MRVKDRAQTRELIRAIRDRLREMTHHLARVEARRFIPGTDGHLRRMEAFALRYDIAEARLNVDWLRHQ